MVVIENLPCELGIIRYEELITIGACDRERLVAEKGITTTKKGSHLWRVLVVVSMVVKGVDKGVAHANCGVNNNDGGVVKVLGFWGRERFHKMKATLALRSEPQRKRGEVGEAIGSVECSGERVGGKYEEEGRGIDKAEASDDEVVWRRLHEAANSNGESEVTYEGRFGSESKSHNAWSNFSSRRNARLRSRSFLNHFTLHFTQSQNWQ
ncbi:hypothetical protein E2542_SST04951 [Spatholobus suberectus]|nr:hypothetical protein E2542_SST04951 [Spatholobus suberectus]